MEQNRPLLVSSEEVKKLPVLIVDKKGMVGVALAKKLQEEFLVVLVSSHASAEELLHRNIIHIPYKKRIPTIPDNIYSHMLLFYSGEIEVIDMLPAFVRKTRQATSRLFFITPLLHGNQRIFEHLSHHAFHDVQTIVYGETFDNNLQEPNLVNFYIHQARVYGRIEVENSGLMKTYPILLEDVLGGIIATAFSDNRKHRATLLFPQHAITAISIIRFFQKRDPLLRVDYVKKKSKMPSHFIPQEGEYVFQNYDIEEKLKKIDLTKRVAYSNVPQKEIKLVMPKMGHQNTFGLVIVSLLILVCLPIVATFSLALVGATSLSMAVDKAEKIQFDSALSYASFARKSFDLANAMTPGLVVFDGILRPQKEQFVGKIQTGREVAVMMDDIIIAGKNIQNIYTGKSTNSKNDFLRATAKLKNALLTLQQLQAESKLPQTTVEKLKNFRNAIMLSENTIDAWPTLFGFTGKKTYLVLFQNNMELRPGGGFIGSYGVLTVENGKMGTFKIQDVYDSDGKLKTHVEPPYGLRRYLGASHWYLRDSNFDVDFIRNSVEAARFLRSETGEVVDGVIAVDTVFLQNMLKSLGSVEVSDYKETVRPDNFYLLTQTHAEKDFFPGSTQKKDFLRALASAMSIRLSEGKNISHKELLQQVVKSIRQKHVLFAFSDQGVQSLFTVNNLSSSLWDGRLPKRNEFLDYLGVIDANLGTNKANFYLNRSFQQSAVIDKEGDFQATTLVTYQNTSKKDSRFGGDYKNYVRFVLPANSTLRSLKIDGAEVAITPAVIDPEIFTKKNFVPPSGIEVERTEEKGKTLIGFFFIVPTEKTRTVAIEYSVSRVVNVEDPSFSYNLFWFKQPGTVEDPYSLSLSYPSSFRLIKATVDGGDVGGKIIESGFLSEDKEIRAEFSKK